MTHLDMVSLELKLNLLFVLAMATLVIICVNGIIRIIESIHTMHMDRKNDNISNQIVELQDEILSTYQSSDLINAHTLHHAFGKLARGVKPNLSVLKLHDNYAYTELWNKELRYTGPYPQYRGKIYKTEFVFRDIYGNMFLQIEGELLEAKFFRAVETESVQEC